VERNCASKNLPTFQTLAPFFRENGGKINRKCSLLINPHTLGFEDWIFHLKYLSFVTEPSGGRGKALK